MICPHGLEQIACPVCRISGKTTPPIGLKIEDAQSEILKPLNPAIKEIQDKRTNMLNLLKDPVPKLSVTPNIAMPEPPNFSKIPIAEPPIHKKLQELDSHVPKELNQFEDISVELPDGKIKKTKKI